MGAYWEQLYQATVLETKPQELPHRIADARAAIKRRLDEGLSPVADAAEARAIEDALIALIRLEWKYPLGNLATVPEEQPGWIDRR
jgi:hypothetical protein